MRVFMFDDLIEKIQLFDPLTGENKQRVGRYSIFPSSHYVTPRDTTLAACKTIKEELKDRLAYFRSQGKEVEAQRLEQRTLFDLEMLYEMGFCKGIENYSRHFTGKAEGEPPPTLLNYLPDNILMFIDESHVTVPQICLLYTSPSPRD